MVAAVVVVEVVEIVVVVEPEAEVEEVVCREQSARKEGKGVASSYKSTSYASLPSIYLLILLGSSSISSQASLIDYLPYQKGSCIYPIFSLRTNPLTTFDGFFLK